MKLKMKRAYTIEEVFEALKREADFLPGIYLYKAVIGGSAIRIPSHCEMQSRYEIDNLSSLVPAYKDIQIYVKNETMRITPNTARVKPEERNNDDYPSADENKNIKKEKPDKVAGVCTELFG